MFSTFTAITPSTYTASYTIPSSKEDSSLCGSYTLSSLILNNGALQGNYYLNRWFAGAPYFTRLDSQVNYNWGTGDVIPETVGDYVSVIWKGFFSPPTTDAYTFTLQSNDGSRLTLNQEVLIDAMSIVTSEL